MATFTLTANKPGTCATCLLGGPGAAVDRVAFEASTDVVSYVALGAGTRTPGCWHICGLGLPLRRSISVRARGYYATGHEDGSGSLAEAVRNWYLEPAPQTLLPLALR